MAMRFPLKTYKYALPAKGDPGAFGTIRRFDVHTGVDLYCEHGDEVVSISDGIVLAVLDFTGPMVESPWWNPTMAVVVRHEFGIVNYGEITVADGLTVGAQVKEGDAIGNVSAVLKRDKGKVPSTSMLHLEMYDKFEKFAEWLIDQPCPEGLADPTELLKSLIKQHAHPSRIHPKFIFDWRKKYQTRNRIFAESNDI